MTAPVPCVNFIIRFLEREREMNNHKSMEQQQKEFLDFIEKAKALLQEKEKQFKEYDEYNSTLTDDDPTLEM